MKLKTVKVLAISGSTRKRSANQAIIEEIKTLCQEKVEVIHYDAISQLPHFMPDCEDEEVPSPVMAFRNAIESADGVLISTPEYVFSLPGVLKNALEWTVSTTVFSQKPLALITASASGEKAHESLLLIMRTLDGQFTDETCLLIRGVKGKIDNKGTITDEDVVKKLEGVMSSFIKAIENKASN